VDQGLDPEAISVVKSHGTGTKSNNEAERNALKDLNTHFVATSYKPKIGHTMGASGLLETLLLLENMRNGFVPEIPNRTEDDYVYLSKPVEAPKGLVLSLAAGMGNIYSAAVFEPMGA
jgi:3-oxoacyl-[acyl-carrier-protein] synthase-1